MSSSHGTCSEKLDFCPKGHYMHTCRISTTENGFLCKQCSDITFQPNQNRYGDQCRYRHNCDRRWMKWKDYGDTTRDATCECDIGFHFESEDQRACVPNKECEKGFGQGLFGICEKCFERNMYSDAVANKNESCKPLRNCEKENRCTIIKSNGTFDNECGPVVEDISQCDHIKYETSTATNLTNSTMFIWITFGVTCIFIILVILAVCYIFTRRRRKAMKRQLKTVELEELVPEIIKRSRKDEVYCKKVLDALQKEIEDRLNNQIWALPRELFPEPAKFEILVEKYKETQHKFAINGYMQDWRSLRGNTGTAVEELINCLKCVNVKRADIVLEVVNKVSKDLPKVCDGYGSHSNRSSKSSSKFCPLICPCRSQGEESEDSECKETSAKLLSIPMVNETEYKLVPSDSHDSPSNDGKAAPFNKQRTTPSAPILHGSDVATVNGTHYDSSLSVPIQARS